MANQKMLHMGIRFWTNGVPSKDKKTAWESGVVYLYLDKDKGIKPDMERFNTIEEITPAIKKILKRNGIKLAANKVKFIFL